MPQKRYRPEEIIAKLREVEAANERSAHISGVSWRPAT
jgi:hypothetical protein